MNCSAGIQKERQTNIHIIFKFVTLALHKLEGTFIWNFIIEFTFNIECLGKKMTHLFFIIAFFMIMLMIIAIHMLNNDTLRIPKW